MTSHAFSHGAAIARATLVGGHTLGTLHGTSSTSLTVRVILELKTALVVTVASHSRGAHGAAIIILVHADPLNRRHSKHVHHTVGTAHHARGAARATWTPEIIRHTDTLPINAGVSLLALNVFVAGLANHCVWLASLRAGRAVHAIAGVHSPARPFGGACVVHAASWSHGRHVVAVEDVALSVGGRLNSHTLHATNIAADVALA
jgi:hypothetical protein